MKNSYTFNSKLEEIVYDVLNNYIICNELNKVLFNADQNCQHVIEELWSGIKCKKCSGWFCY